VARILIVDDDKLSSAALAALLRGLGHEILRAYSVREALDAGSTGVDLLVSDLCLPDGRGEVLATSLRVPAIAMSGLDSTADRQKSLAAGFALHLVKPIELDELEAAVKRLLAGTSSGMRS
jgi:DNA-binding response OmpR family regulator